MKPNPIISAGAAVAYIALIVLFMRYIESVRHDTPDTYIDGMGFISLFVFSAAVMAFLFFYQPVRLLIDKKPADAVAFFLKTISAFGIATIAFLTLASLQ